MSHSQSKRSDNSNPQSEGGDGTPQLTSGLGGSVISRRRFLRAGVAVGGVAVAGVGGYVWWRRQPPDHDLPRLTVEEAFAKAKADELILVDIRTPREWRASGVPVGSHQIDMRRDDFLAALDQVTGGNRSAALALICARGVRSARVTLALDAAGYSNVIDVPEGMLGSAAGPGWLRSNLPVARWTGQG
ncbi:Rhodanese-related protein sulfurtransferase [Phaeobacter piscinae]|uniref:Rhodanese-related protein sulfurtransferase n=1 Tax=Phaeobacter piscinae TaxID=1580596 RepID=A0AAD0G0U2_9RHOB|nr:rhodanese-like domain-containing protein [Phaeobacter piscinae]ATG43101.1 Rhodanese-related protein sulfurtransferase [Phaeobacter piscinae]AUQ74673.1 Rhodanese-related protein sulfurtransferase [Phaeobacter piscinae]AUR35419.1 Rhodanese-related protein sulfurtransferase [Phaeobacter piscinae]